MINVRIQTPEVQKLSPKITVVGVGGAGGNAVNNMISSGLEGCEFLVCNTDSQALDGSLCDNQIQLGANVTGGLGAGAKPEIGESAAQESIDEVMQYLDGSNMAFITAGMGGGTGTGAAPIIAKACRDAGILTVGVVTKPFHFEGTHRMRQAEAGIEEMQDFVDTLIVIPNQNLFRVANEKTTFAEAFKLADGVLQSGVRGVTDLMVMPGLINLDFADIRSAMLEMGKAMMGNGEAEGERRAVEAAESAINNPLLDDVSMKGARGVIINVTGGHDMTLYEVDEACNRIRDEVDPNANIIFGSTFDEKMEGNMRVSVVATGIEMNEASKTRGSTGGVRVTAVGKQSGLNETAKPALERATPAAMTAASSKPQTEVAREMTMMARKDTSSSAPRALEPEADMFEQREFTAPTSATSSMGLTSTTNSMRGSVQGGNFIPPSPIVPEKQDVIPHTMPSAPSSATPAYAAAPAQQQATPQQTSYAEPQQQQAMSQAPAPASQGGLVLRPPVPGAHTAERKKSPSLFERITGVGGFGHSSQETQSAGDSSQGSQGTGSAGAFHGGMRAERSPQAPSQGQLNIDSPAASRVKSDEDLDIPAFLRRQAN